MCRIRNLSIEPFAKYSAEEELDVLDAIFYTPSFYSELLNLVSGGNSRFIIGKRGQGKSAIIYKLFHDLHEKNVLPLLITRYDGIPLVKNANYFLYKIIQSITKGLAQILSEQSNLRKHLSKNQKKKFNVLLEMFYDPNWAEDFMETAKHIKNKKRKISIQRFFNKNLKIINGLADGTIKISSEIIRRSFFGDSTFNFDDAFREFFSTITVDDFHRLQMANVGDVEKQELINMLQFLLGVSSDIYLKSIVILFDKIDEFSELESNVDSVSKFMKDLLIDTEFLYTQKLGIVFSLWSEVKRSLNNQGVRFDKFKDVDIRWSEDDLESIINHRLRYYSKDKKVPVSLGVLIPDEQMKKEVLTLADKSPRSLIALLNNIYYADTRNNIVSFTPEAIAKGMIKFCKDYDYVSVLPFRITKREDLRDWINKILAIRNSSFTIQDYMKMLGIKITPATAHIKELKKLGLIKTGTIPTQDGDEIFEVVDPRIKHLISRAVLALE